MIMSFQVRATIISALVRKIAFYRLPYQKTRQVYRNLTNRMRKIQKQNLRFPHHTHTTFEWYRHFRNQSTLNSTDFRFNSL